MRFMFQSLANRNDSNSIAALRVCERYDDAHDNSKGNIARLALVFARIFDGNQWTIEDYRGIVKVAAVFGEIERSLLFIPREHVRSVATLCRYIKIANCLLQILNEIDSLPHLRNLNEMAPSAGRGRGQDEADDEGAQGGY